MRRPLPLKLLVLPFTGYLVYFRTIYTRWKGLIDETIAQESWPGYSAACGWRARTFAPNLGRSALVALDHFGAVGDP
jgi:hypothetical protein